MVATCWLVCLLIIGAVVSIIWSCNNQQFYQRPIGKVVSVQVTHQQKTQDQFNNRDQQFKQRVTLQIMNGRHRGQRVTTNNTYSKSGGMDQKYRRGQQAFLTQLRSDHGQLTANVTGLKRDTTVVVLTWLVILLLIIMMGKVGVFALLSALLNVGLFIAAIQIDIATQAQYILPIFAGLSFLMALATLTFVYGWNKQTFATLLATMLGVGISLGTFLLVSSLTNERGIYYEAMQFVTQNYRLLYLAEIMIGCLGAVMDESSDILATMFEVKRLDPQVQWRKLFAAGRQVGQTVMGPLTNILLMIFLFSTLTNAVLMLRNGNSWGYTFSMTMSLGVAQSLVSGIGIVVTIPVVSLVTSLLIAKEGTK
ncbi:YibE/F-like protein [Limosilactobacillus coleohominis 101-4-CHN]|uniref:YibE/F-like protein n=1 Tax=Limosilactobacillus coleohominis 101-4-CHN TaxID=575594 RepID=C7XWQ3_9LACO|nr:YibE/F family protein [Limosilactobacillus coleohominis]EEU30051.1 YibE/F-like protein [Limosilactobacillus coleohominis 101-4-CHN]